MDTVLVHPHIIGGFARPVDSAVMNVLAIAGAFVRAEIRGARSSDTLAMYGTYRGEAGASLGEKRKGVVILRQESRQTPIVHEASCVEVSSRIGGLGRWR